MKVLIAGDFCPQHRVAEKFEKNNYETVLGEIKEIISDADYSIVNFECSVTKGGEKPIEKHGPNLQCSEKGIEAVKWAGFDCVTLANNHFLDYGKEGVEGTLEACRKYGVDTVGGGMNLSEASKIHYKEIEGKILAIVNCCEHEFSIATNDTAGSNPLNPIQQFYAIKEARTKADYVLVIVHGGHEHYQLPSPRMQETYRFFVDAGADAVVNHHQHCYSGYEVYNRKPIFYGLGNFCFDGNRSGLNMWYEGYMVIISFDSSISISVIPYMQCKEEPIIHLLKMNSYDSQLQALNNIISDPDKLSKETEKYFKLCSNTYSNIFEPLYNRYYLGAKYRGWLPSLITKKKKLEAANYIMCEAHRDKLIYYFCN